jgi:hypothetical protein
MKTVVRELSTQLGDHVRVQMEEADAKFLLALHHRPAFGHRRFNELNSE